jgi:spore maturation protein CgeB
VRLVVLGLSITSSWGNGHATTYRALLKGVAALGHEVTFLERRMPWYEEARDLPQPPFCRTLIYDDLPELFRRHARRVADADAVIVGSYVPDGVAVGHWVCATAGGVRAFYDIDTPVTLAKLARGDSEYLAADQIGAYDVYLSFTGGPTLRRLEQELGARRARALFCSVDAEAYRPLPVPKRFRLGYLGTYSADRQPKVERLLLQPARRLPGQLFAVAGALYPAEIAWPGNVEHVPHLPPGEHAAFYASQTFTLNVTRADMVAAGHSPSVRLFEAAACGVPIVSDSWAGLDQLFRPGREILLADDAEAVLEILEGLDEERAAAIGAAARAVVLRRHTALARARELETHLAEAALGRARPARTGALATVSPP